MLGCSLCDHIAQNSTGRITFCVFTRPQSQVWESGYLAFGPTIQKQDRGAWWTIVHGNLRVRPDWVTQQTCTHRQKQDNGSWGDYMLYMTDPKSSVSSLPSFSPVLTHLLGYKLISQHLSFHRCPSARSQTWTDSAPLQPCSFSWAARWAASLEVIATRLRVSPSSSLLYRPEGKEVSPWKRQENGYGGCCQPSLDFFWKVNGWTLGTFLDSQKSVIMCSAFNKNLPPHFAESWTSSLTLSIARLYPVPKNHFRIVKRSIFDTCPGSCPIPPKTLGFYCLSLSNKISGEWGLR